MAVSSSLDGWRTHIMSANGNVAIDCNVPKDRQVPQKEWNAGLEHVLQCLSAFNSLGMEGELAVPAALKEQSELIRGHSGIRKIAYVQPDGSSTPLYTWPEVLEGFHHGSTSDRISPTLPFYQHKWSGIPLYHGNYAPVANVRFGIEDAVKVSKAEGKDIWLVLLEAYVGELGNDAILQKFAFVETFDDKRYVVHEGDQVIENASRGGPYDWIMDGLIVTARKDVIAGLPNHDELGNVLITVDLDNLAATQTATFRSPSPELLPVGKDLDRELVKYLHRFPEHVVHLPGNRFEKLIAEILASHGFSDIQLNVRNSFGEIDIVAFERTKEGIRRGYIVECKRYSRARKVALREAHVLAMKRILMASQGIDRAMLVTTSDFTKPTRSLYDSAWGVELKAYDAVVEWLRCYKVNRDGLYFQQ